MPSDSNPATLAAIESGSSIRIRRSQRRSFVLRNWIGIAKEGRKEGEMASRTAAVAR
jgi:hypothetical protein